MQTEHITTPFGRRAMTYAMLESQKAAGEIDDDASVNKWEIFRALAAGRRHFGVSDRALAILNALLTFYPKAELCGDDNLIVFPSNQQLSMRAHGMAEPTIRRHVASLVEAGLLIRRDSANGKRFARRGQTGEVDEAFGFSLAPLLARAEEILMIAADVEAERLALQRQRERLTICRRDVVKLIETALDEGAPGDWEAVYAQYRAIMAALPRNKTLNDIETALGELDFLRENILNVLETQFKAQKTSANPDHTERHKQNSNPDSKSELEPRLEEKRGEISGPNEDQEGVVPDGDVNLAKTELLAGNLQEREIPIERTPAPPERKSLDNLTGLKPFPLGMVLNACPQIIDYGPGGEIVSWRDMMAAAVVVRSMLGVSPSAYEEACGVLGPENAATVIACILERAGHINSAGGYIRDLTRRAERGEFSLGPMLMAQMRVNGISSRRAG